MRSPGSVSAAAILLSVGLCVPGLPGVAAPVAGGGAIPAAQEGNAVVSGKTTRGGEGAGGARVFAYRSFEEMLARRPAAVSRPAAEDGSFRLELQPGSYYLLARDDDGGIDGPLPVGGLFSYHGTNPFALAAGAEVEANFALVRKTAEPEVTESGDPSSGAIEGVVTHRGEPLEGVRVRLYLDPGGNFRGSAYAVSSPTESDGWFRFDYLPASAYYIVAHRRAGGAGAGPLAEGDFYGYFVDNPVQVAGGTLVKVAVEVVNKARDAGRDVDRPYPLGTRIEGTITGPDGRPVREAYAFAYEEKVMAHKKPAFISGQVGDDGRYVIYFSRGGTFYIGARSSYGDSPAKGEWYGRYDGSADHSVQVEPGEALEGIDIVVERILP